MNRIDLTLILLAFNEEENLERAAEKCLQYLDGLEGEHELIIVDDGSADGTAEIARSIVEKRSNVKLLQHETNLGMGAGMRTGILNAEQEYFEMLPADLQIDPFETDKLLLLLPEADFVISRYKDRNDGVLRRVLSWGLRFLMRLFLGGYVPLEGLYLFPTRAAKTAIQEGVGKSDTFVFSFELLHAAVQRGMKYETAYIECKPRLGGRSKVANIRRIAGVFKELVQIRSQQRP